MYDFIAGVIGVSVLAGLFLIYVAECIARANRNRKVRKRQRHWLASRPQYEIYRSSDGKLRNLGRKS